MRAEIWSLASVLAFFVLFVAIAPYACTAPEWSRVALTSQGFTDIQMGGYMWFACGRDDGFSTSFAAKNTLGQRVEGVVCCGLLKSCTVRWG